MLKDKILNIEETENEHEVSVMTQNVSENVVINYII